VMNKLKARKSRFLENFIKINNIGNVENFKSIEKASVVFVEEVGNSLVGI